MRRMMSVRLCATIWSQRQATIPRAAHARMLRNLGTILSCIWNNDEERLLELA
jgi:hypothetical protein